MCDEQENALTELADTDAKNTTNMIWKAYSSAMLSAEVTEASFSESGSRFILSLRLAHEPSSYPRVASSLVSLRSHLATQSYERSTCNAWRQLCQPGFSMCNT